MFAIKYQLHQGISKKKIWKKKRTKIAFGMTSAV